MQTRSKCRDTPCPSDTTPRRPANSDNDQDIEKTSGEDAGRYIGINRFPIRTPRTGINVAACVSQADERRDTKRHAVVCGRLIRAICLTFGIAPIIAMGGDLDHPLPHWSSIPSQPVTRQLTKGSQLLFAESGDAVSANYFVYADDQLHAFTPTADKPLWTKPAQCRLLPRILTLSKTRAVLANRYEIFAIDMRDGSRAWTFGDYPDNLGDVRFDHENAPSFRYFTTSPDRIFAVRDNGELNVIDMQTGDAIATHVLSHHPVNQPVVCGDRLIFAARTRDGERVCIVRFVADKIEHVADLNLGATAAALTVTDNDIVIAASVAGVSAIDPDEGGLRWQRRSKQPMVATSLRVAGDGIYIATQDKIVMKLWLTGGAEAWRSQPLALQRDGATRLEVVDDHVIAIGDGFANILESASGKIIATPWTDVSVSADHCVLTSQYMALLTPQESDSTKHNRSIQIYDHGSSEKIVAPKSMDSVGPFAESPKVIAMDDALIIHDGKRIHIWRVPSNPHRRLKSSR